MSGQTVPADFSGHMLDLDEDEDLEVFSKVKGREGREKRKKNKTNKPEADSQPQLSRRRSVATWILTAATTQPARVLDVHENVCVGVCECKCACVRVSPPPSAWTLLESPCGDRRGHTL